MTDSNGTPTPDDVPSTASLDESMDGSEVANKTDALRNITSFEDAVQYAAENGGIAEASKDIPRSPNGKVRPKTAKSVVPNSRKPKSSEWWPDKAHTIEHPGLHAAVCYDGEHPITYRLVWPKNETTGEVDTNGTPKRFVLLRGRIRAERMYRVLEVRDDRTCVRSDAGERYEFVVEMVDEPEPVKFSASHNDLINTRDQSGWMKRTNLGRFLDPRHYGTIRSVLFASVNHALKTNSITREEVFGETGIVVVPEDDGTRWVFLTPGSNGAVTPDGWAEAYRTELPEALSGGSLGAFGYRPADTSKTALRKSFEELFKIFDVTTERKWIPTGLLGVTGVAPLYGMFSQLFGVEDGGSVVLSLVGPTKQMKTTLATLILPNQSPTVRGRGIQPSLNLRPTESKTTAFAAEFLLSHYGGFAAVVDDALTRRQIASPGELGNAMRKVESLITHLQGEPARKGMWRKDTGADVAKSHKPKTSLVFTMEDLPRDADWESTVNRMVVMEHTSSEYVNKRVLTRLQTRESGNLRFNAQCYFVQSLLSDPATFTEAWDEAGAIVDGWEFADFDRERDNYRRVMAGVIALIRVGESVGAKNAPSVEEVAGWLYEAATLQSQWITGDSLTIADPLDTFRDAHSMLVMEKRITYGSDRLNGEQYMIVPPYEKLGSFSLRNLGWYASFKNGNKPDALKQDGSAVDLNDAFDEDTPFGSVRPLSDMETGKFVPKVSPRQKFAYMVKYNAEGFHTLFMMVEQWTRRNNRAFVTKAELIRSMVEAGIAQEPESIKYDGKSAKCIRIDAEWLYRKNGESE